MSFAQILTSVSVLNSGLIGYQGISLTNFSATTESYIALGSSVEIAGTFFKAKTNIVPEASSWTAITTATTAYLALTPSGTAGSQILTAAWVSSGSAIWSDDKQGWYNSGETARLVVSVYKGSATQYIKKKVLRQLNKAFLDAEKSSDHDALPVGTILMYDGSGWTDDSTIPGWYACISANSGYGCPNLVDKFIMGKVVAGSGGTGGSNTHTNTEAEMPAHTHTGPSHTHTGPSHTHTGPSHTHTMAHTHSYEAPYYPGSITITYTGAQQALGVTSNTTGDANPGATGAAGTGATGDASAGATGAAGTGASGSTGSSTAFDIRPAYYTVIYIRKCF